mmetsp:Transcript_7600/g.14116  ORF Transcript_7600/g.14116 Transcript_7600/m.14116 type:complete len:91 (+) Transcript_7600:130-402(+)
MTRPSNFAVLLDSSSDEESAEEEEEVVVKQPVAKDAAAPAKVAPYSRAAGMTQGTKDAQIAAQREKEEREERAVAKKKGNKKKGRVHKDV